MACLVALSFGPAGSATTQALYTCESCGGGRVLPIASSQGASGVWKKKKKQMSLLTTGLQRTAVRGDSPTRCCATLPESDGPYLKDLQVPAAWSEPSVATQEAEWLRGSLHQWLDEEYCPEPANIEISQRCSRVYYYCLLEQQVDIGDILLQMVRDLETFSFKESFHGAFSSANAAIALITKRMEETQKPSDI